MRRIVRLLQQKDCWGTTKVNDAIDILTRLLNYRQLYGWNSNATSAANSYMKELPLILIESKYLVLLCFVLVLSSIIIVQSSWKTVISYNLNKIVLVLSKLKINSNWLPMCRFTGFSDRPFFKKILKYGYGKSMLCAAMLSL